ncbi:MAG TPA: FAD-dependent oxidoreductase, partial [Abditibacterium sp.]
MKKLVVIGNGMAGARVASDILARGGAAQFEITVFGEEPGGNYNRIMLSDVLNGSKSEHSIVLHPLEWYEKHGIRLLSGEKATCIDRENQLVCGDFGSVEPFDILIVATGSRAYVPPISGLETSDGTRKAGVFVLRTLADCARIAGYAAKAPRAIVVGGGLLGLEAARGLIQHGARVHLVNRSDGLMSGQLDATGSQLLQTAIEKMGIQIHLNRASTRILGEESVTGLEFKDGDYLAADMIVFACGITPNIELARESGLRVERAMVVDDQMRCEGETAIFAVGECAQHRGQVYGLVAPIWEQSRVLADVLTGKNPRAAYLGSKTSTKLKVMGVELASMGTPVERDGDEVIEYLERKRARYKKLVIRDGKLVGAILLGDLA